MQESNGEIFTTAHRPAIPRRSDIVNISRLSSLRFGVINLLRIAPLAIPIAKAPILYTMGMMISEAEIFAPTLTLTKADAALKAMRHTASSNATTCSKVFIKSPRA